MCIQYGIYKFTPLLIVVRAVAMRGQKHRVTEYDPTTTPSRGGSQGFFLELSLRPHNTVTASLPSPTPGKSKERYKYPSHLLLCSFFLSSPQILTTTYSSQPTLNSLSHSTAIYLHPQYSIPFFIKFAHTTSSKRRPLFTPTPLQITLYHNYEILKT